MWGNDLEEVHIIHPKLNTAYILNKNALDTKFF